LLVLPRKTLQSKQEPGEGSDHAELAAKTQVKQHQTPQEITKSASKYPAEQTKTGQRQRSRGTGGENQAEQHQTRKEIARSASKSPAGQAKSGRKE
jgi:hypothetical protein